jgi:hypothetical protein
MILSRIIIHLIIIMSLISVLLDGLGVAAHFHLMIVRNFSFKVEKGREGGDQ